MPKTTTPKGIKATPVKREARDDVPQFFRLNVEVGDLDGAIAGALSEYHHCAGT